MQTLIKSTHIFPDSLSNPFSGYLLLKNEKFDKLIPETEITPEILSQCETFQDFGDAYILPGLIDLNVYLNSNYEEEWNDVENISKMAAQGGITTIIDNPVMNNYDAAFNEIEAISARIQKIQSNISVDCGLFGLVSIHNYLQTPKIWSSGNILGFKMFLSPNLQHNVPWIDSSKRHLKQITEFMQRNMESDVLLSVHSEMATSRDLFMCSPLRTSPKEKRLDLTEELKDSDKFGGGIHGEMDDAEDSNKSSSEEEKEDTVDELMSFTKDPRVFDEGVTSSTLKTRSKTSAEIQDQRAIHVMEMMGYSLKDEEDEEMVNLNDSDIELKKSRETSEDEDENDDEEEKIMRRNCVKKSIFSKKFGDKPDITTTLEINKMFKEKLRTAIFLQTSPENEKVKDESPPIKIPSNPSKDNITINLNFMNGEAKKTYRSSEHPYSEDMNDNNLNNQSDDEKKLKRPSSLLMRRSTSRNISTKSVDLSLSPTSAMKEELRKLKSAAENSSYKMFLMNHYVAWEINGAKQILNNFRKTSTVRVLISNISTPSAAFIVRNEKKKKEDLQVYCETSIPYLFFHSTLIKNGECKFKGSPPIRDQETRNLLIAGLNIKDLFHCISSFHFEVPSKYKNIEKGNFKRCFNGFSVIGFNLQVVWTKLYGSLKNSVMKKQGNNEQLNEKIIQTMKNIIKLMCEKPAEMLRLEGKKGKIQKGLDADFVVWDPFKIEQVTDEKIHLKYKKTFLLRNYKLYGTVLHTFLRGKPVFSCVKGKPVFIAKQGQILFKNNL